eukprot:TRINITY_DN2660_c0_g1_i6.p1 TRINITY_DN2660_c0_g1~~TRINITY_DN2660_c0_g1_i6.p1  ORF type:complete len:394 (+),score=77.87 TRINITY_DN2660_c0_g1_i6:79-1260(+)
MAWCRKQWYQRRVRGVLEEMNRVRQLSPRCRLLLFVILIVLALFGFINSVSVCSPHVPSTPNFEIEPYLYVPVGETGPPRRVLGPVTWESLPTHVQDEFLLGGKVNLDKSKYTEQDKGGVSWKGIYAKDQFEKQLKAGIEALRLTKEGKGVPANVVSDIRPGWYPCLVKNLLKALQEFDISGKDILVVNPGRPWNEALALDVGVRGITVTDRLNIVPGSEYEGQPKMKFVLSSNLTGKFDAIFKMDDTYSSFMHYGVGRYGDPIDPNGDIKIIQALKTFLKPDGYLFFSLPLGPDTLEYNLHRIYGRERYALMTRGLNILKQYPCHPTTFPTIDESFQTLFKNTWENQWLTVAKLDLDEDKTVCGETLFLGVVGSVLSSVIMASFYSKTRGSK